MADNSAIDLPLEDQIQSLPQELQDEIFAQWMQFAPGTIVIDENYKPPAQLQIDKKISRRSY
ncbi:hypothetical protein Slin14017_G079170 [Septoria linicola]|nr:hypothetical protein Slin14017_G079170 [Septoria linicola]